MQFRLTYEGPLKATQRDARGGEPSRHAENKHHMRMCFHKQLERLWAEIPNLNGKSPPGFIALDGGQMSAGRHRIKCDSVANDHKHFGVEFVPLVTSKLNLACDIDILMLRPERPGRVVWAGDIDNRLKTLLDSLRIPESSERYEEKVSILPKRIFCLLEDDKLITRVSVETDRLLSDLNDQESAHDVKIVISIRLKPYLASPESFAFF